MYKKFLNSRLKVAAVVLFVTYLVLSIIINNWPDKPAQNRPVEIVSKNAADVPPSLDIKSHIDAKMNGSQNTGEGSGIKAVEDNRYGYEKRESGYNKRESPVQQPTVKEATPDQILTEKDMPPEIKKLRDRIKNMSIPQKPPKVIRVMGPIILPKDAKLVNPEDENNE